MLNYLKHYKKLIIFLVLALLIFSGNLLDFSTLWLFIILPSVLAIFLLIYEFLLSRVNKAEIAFWDIKEFGEHQKLSIDALEDIFRDERSSEGFSLKTQLYGTIKGNHEMQAPLSQTLCFGYKLTVGLLKAKDFLNTRQSFTRLLINELKTSRLSLQQDDDSIAIEGEPLLNLKNRSVKNVSWNGLKKLNEKINNKINEALTMQNISRGNYTGVSITEELLVPDIDYTVFGLCRKRGNKCIIEGNSIVDNPESLYITSYSPSERQLYLEQMRKRVRLRKALIYPLIVLLLAGPGYYAYDVLFKSKGEIYYRKSTQAYKIDINTGGSDLYWEFDSSDTADSIRLTGKDDSTVYADENSTIEIFRQLKETGIFTVGRDSIPVWNGVLWELDLADKLPAVLPPGNTGTGSRIYIKNITERDLTISFIQQAGAVTPDQTWNWGPGHGTDWEYGSYAIYNEKKGGEKIKKDLLLSEGDVIVAAEDDNIVRSYIVGYSGEIRYIENTGWYLLLDEKSITLKSGKLFVKNTSSEADYVIHILDFQGKYKYDDYWDFPAGKAADSENGLSLIYRIDEENTVDILLYEGMQLKVLKTEYQPVWKGKMGKCPYAAYNRMKKNWEISIE